MSRQVFEWSWNILGQVLEAPFVWKLSNYKMSSRICGGEVCWVSSRICGGGTVKIASAPGPDSLILNLNRIK